MTFQWSKFLGRRRHLRGNPAMREVPRREIEIDYEYASPQHYNESPVYYIAGNRFVLGAGSRDAVTVFTDGETYWFLVENTGLGYVGLEVHQPEGMEAGPDDTKVGDAFFQEHWEIEQVSKDWDELDDLEKVRMLSDYIY